MPARERPVKVRACDGEDLRIVAALLQDALIPLGDMRFLAKEGRFVAVCDRFMWECAGNGSLHTVKCGLCFENVGRVKCNGIDQQLRDQVLELLTVIPQEGPAVNLVFAGGGILRLEVRGIDCYVKDLGEPRPAPVRPRHPILVT